MHPEIESLAVMIDEAENILRKHRISHWADWLKEDSRFIRNLDFYGIEHLLSAFGGMGSLNDLRLSEGRKSSPNELVASPDDERFHSLLTEIHALATKLSREEYRA